MIRLDFDDSTDFINMCDPNTDEGFNGIHTCIHYNYSLVQRSHTGDAFLQYLSGIYYLGVNKRGKLLQ